MMPVLISSATFPKVASVEVKFVEIRETTKSHSTINVEQVM